MKAAITDTCLREAMFGICRTVLKAGGRAFLVGGCVRDALLEKPIKDVDIEVYGIPPDRLKALLGANFEMDLVGESFGVLKIRRLPIDVSIPRRESRTGAGHREFDVASEPFLAIEEAASRRDFTINSMLLDPLNEELHDPFGGQSDLAGRILRHTSHKFGEDPLRVLRGMQFAARLNLTPAPETVALCAAMVPDELTRERIFEEWKKLILNGVTISRGLEFLKDCGWTRYYPELQALTGCRQDPAWHPEGDVWQHNLLCMDAFASERTGDEHEDLVVGFAVLCHDFGKPATTVELDGRLRSPGHSEAGEELTRSFMGRLTNQRDLVGEIIPLVVHHLRPMELFQSKAGDSAIRRLARRVGRIDRLVRAARADQRGRDPANFDGFQAGEWLLLRADELQVRDSAPKPIVMGRHLIDLGVTPGPVFKDLLAACYDAQLSGDISDLEEGIALVEQLLRKEQR